ncbi:MAG TPA: protease pro-enzyme activation domain-containing protein [Acidobacteriaceae bacterium]|nr:protease pro-enzyme activation domain-containing protein [Acidobacteriaceae bacterium]
MSTQTLRRILTVTLLLLSLQTAFAAGLADRLASGNWTATAAVPGSVHPLARPEFDRGAVPDTMPLTGLALNFQRSAAQQAALETLLAGQSDPDSPLFHQWLTPEQFAAQFGMSAQDIATATAWLTSQGFTVVKVADSGNAILFAGTAGQVHHAFGTEIHHYQVNSQTHYANASAVTLPAALAGAVTGVSGLNDFHPVPQSVRSQAATAGSGAAPLFTSGISGSHFLAPGDFSTIYDVKTLTGGGYTGTGETIGIAGQTDVVLSDITAFRAAAGLSVNNPTIVLAGSGDPGVSYTDLPEADIDLEWSGGIAPSANIVYLNSNDVFTSLAYGIQNRVTVNSVSTLIPILSLSYGACEAESSGTIAMLEPIFQQAASQGQTVIVASGDSGAAGCDTGTASNPVTTSTHGLAVDYPASSAYVTAMGGTEFTEGSALGASAYWSSNWPNSGNDSPSYDVVNSAISYIPEMGWDDTPTAALASYYDGLLGSGGGASSSFSKPTWQTGVAGIPADGKRDVPDIALNASPVHDPYLVCTQVQLVSTETYTGSCGNGFRVSDGSYADNNELTVYGGTSLGTPSFAGVLALIEQKLGAPQGTINKALYTIASNSTTYASAFHDVTVGSNIMPCSGGTGCTNGLLGYDAGTGYDQVTGLGSIDANNLATAFAAYVLGNGGKIGTSVALGYLPATPAIGQTVTFTATVTPNSGSGTPAGTVTFSVDGNTIGSAVTLVSGVASTTYSFASGGTHTVIASYSGDSGDYASISPTVTISNFTNAGGAAATTTTLTPSSSSASLYSSSSPAYTAVVSSATAGTLSGTTVTFTVGSGSSAVSTKVPTGVNENGVSTSSCSTTSCTVTLLATAVTTANGYPAAGGATAVSAHYDGNTGYQQSTSNTLSIAVAAPAFTITAPTITISSAAPGTSTVTVTSTGGFADPVYLTLSSTTISFCYGFTVDPVQPPANLSVTTMLSITSIDACSLAVPGTTGSMRRNIAGSASLGHDDTRMARGAGAVLAVLCLAGCMARRRRRLPRLAAVAAIIVLGGLLAGATGCGGYAPGSGSSSGLPTGSYIITVTGTDLNNALVPTVSTNFTLTVN